MIRNEKRRFAYWIPIAAIASGMFLDDVTLANSKQELVDLVPYVDPLIGTGPSLAPNPVPGGRGGSTFPGAQMPFGMVQWGPDTPHGEPSGYGYNDQAIEGFSLTHFNGAGCPNNGDIPIVATHDENITTLPFSHANEKAEPGYYGVTFDNGIRVELTATTRTGFGRFTFPSSSPAVVVIDPTRTQTFDKTDGAIELKGQDTVQGWTLGGNFCFTGTNYKVYFHAKFDRPWTSSSLKDGKLALRFDSAANPLVNMKVGLSYVSTANAAMNLESESPGRDFDAVRSKARDAWNERLNSIVVSGGSQENRVKFYTALYHSFMAPNVFSDVNGEYIGFDDVVRNAGSRVHYANFSGWDIYRSQIQLLAWLYPELTSEILQSFVVDANECGTFPKWSHNNDEANVMVGDPGSMIVASGYAFGARDFDTKRALEIMKKVGTTPNLQCNKGIILFGLTDYISLGYLSSLQWGGASSTLEYASRDFAAAQFARAMGDEDEYRILRARSTYWQNVLHPGGLIQTRLPNGEFQLPLAKPGEGSNKFYVEGNAEQYTWMVPHDARTLFDLLGGNAAVIARLDRFFSNLNAGMDDPNFYMGNEPSFATPWMYNWAGAPARTAAVIRRIIDEEFTTLPGGLPGNDDLGATSSWYVWANLGLYPQIPGIAGFALTSPLFPSAKVHLSQGRTVEINAPESPARFVQRLAVNGREQKSSWLDLNQLEGNAVLNFSLGETPSSWASEAAYAPPSFGAEEYSTLADAHNSKAVSVPYQVTDVDFDGYGYSYSLEALKAAGLQKDSVSYAGIRFPWSESAVNNSIVHGQKISFPKGTKGGRLAFLGSSTSGSSKGTGLIHYADGGTAPFTLEFSDWTLRGNFDSLAASNEIALQMPYRNHKGGLVQETTNYVFYTAVPIDPARDVASITLPRFVTSSRMHIFSTVIGP